MFMEADMCKKGLMPRQLAWLGGISKMEYSLLFGQMGIPLKVSISNPTALNSKVRGEAADIWGVGSLIQEQIRSWIYSKDMFSPVFVSFNEI